MGSGSRVSTTALKIGCDPRRLKKIPCKGGMGKGGRQVRHAHKLRGRIYGLAGTVLLPLLYFS
jgi:hypothetical protein